MSAMVSTKKRWFAAAVLVLLVGCSTQKAPKWSQMEPENFSTTASHARRFETTAFSSCEAGRRALLGQGYLIEKDTVEKGLLQVTGRKFFQPQPDVHVPLEMRLVCVSESGISSIVYAVAVQEVYTARKSKQSASLGVGGVGSLSLPVEGGNDGMVKVGTKTVSDPRFYDSFFAAVEANIDTR